MPSQFFFVHAPCSCPACCGWFRDGSFSVLVAATLVLSANRAARSQPGPRAAAARWRGVRRDGPSEAPAAEGSYPRANRCNAITAFDRWQRRVHDDTAFLLSGGADLGVSPDRACRGRRARPPRAGSADLGDCAVRVPRALPRGPRQWLPDGARHRVAGAAHRRRRPQGEGPRRRRRRARVRAAPRPTAPRRRTSRRCSGRCPAPRSRTPLGCGRRMSATRCCRPRYRARLRSSRRAFDASSTR